MDNTNNKSLRALIVEDSGDDVLLLVNALNDGGYSVSFDVVDTPAELQALLVDGQWDIVLCDHRMPRLDSSCALDIVRAHAPDMPFIIVSGSIAEEMAVRAMRQGAADFVAKDNLLRLVPVVERELRDAATRLDLRQAREALERSSSYDASTGLANSEHLLRQLRDLSEHGFPFMLALVEVQRLRQFMQTVGAGLGKHFIAEVGERLRGLFDGAFAARLGDDLFALVLDKSDPAEAERAARAILVGMARPVCFDGYELLVSCQVGISLSQGAGVDAGKLFDQAGIALQWSREHAHGYAVYESSVNAAQEERIEMERALCRALHNREFVIHYQPQFDLPSGAIVGVEALLRWNRPGHGLVPPAKFIPLLEETQLIVPVGEWVMQSACEANCRWQAAGMARVRTAVNLSAIQFRQGNLLEVVDSALEKYKLDSSLLELEITENIAMYNEQETIATLAALKNRGIDLAIDDFGTGYSSLSYLKQFPVGKLKIDRSFVSDITHDADAIAIVKAILAMAASLKLGVIAEGVETVEQADFLREHGCREAQGYYFGRPMPEEKLVRMLKML